MRVPLNGRVESAYNWFKERERELLNAADSNGGRLPRQDAWRYAYYQEPYLLLESDKAVLERFGDIVSNIYELTAEGQIGMLPVLSKGIGFMQLFTEILEETNWRGILDGGAAVGANQQLDAYFQNGVPLGVTMFRDTVETPTQWLLKFSNRTFVSEMYEYGRFQISPASYYSQGNHIRAMKDLETKRHYKLKAIREVIEGADSIQANGQKVPIIDGVVHFEILMEDYYLFSTCKVISRRMPTDFNADAVLVIKDRPEFIRRFSAALLQRWPAWEFLEGEVSYFDPYNDIPNNANPEFLKHLSFAYQNEHRCVLRQKRRQRKGDALAPFFVELGPLADISEVIMAP